MGALARFLCSDLPVGLKIIVASIGAGVLGALPLLVYIVVGPPDGNPIGLGLLFVAGLFLAKIGIVIGIVCLFIEHFLPRKPT